MGQPRDCIVYGSSIDRQTDSCNPVILQCTSQTREKRTGEDDQEQNQQISPDEKQLPEIYAEKAGVFSPGREQRPEKAGNGFPHIMIIPFALPFIAAWTNPITAY